MENNSTCNLHPASVPSEVLHPGQDDRTGRQDRTQASTRWVVKIYFYLRLKVWLGVVFQNCSLPHGTSQYLYQSDDSSMLQCFTHCKSKQNLVTHAKQLKLAIPRCPSLGGILRGHALHRSLVGRIRISEQLFGMGGANNDHVTHITDLHQYHDHETK